MQATWHAAPTSTILYCCPACTARLLLAQAVAFRRVLQQRAPRDALSSLRPLLPDAREWLERRQSLTREWVEAGAPPEPPPPRGAWRKATTRVVAAPSAVAAAVVTAVSPPAAAAPAARAGAAAAPPAAELALPLLAGPPWGSDDEEGSEGMQSAASHAAASSSRANSFCTALSEPIERSSSDLDRAV
jgi:hypothetical protein